MLALAFTRLRDALIKVSVDLEAGHSELFFGASHPAWRVALDTLAPKLLGTCTQDLSQSFQGNAYIHYVAAMWPGRHVALFGRALGGVDLASQPGPFPAMESLNATLGQHDLEQLIHALEGSQGLQGLAPRHGGASGAGAFLAGFLFCAFLVAAFW